MNVMTPIHDQGTAYEMSPSSYKAALTEVRRGTPMGELLRRYWHPVDYRRTREHESGLARAVAK